MVLLHTENDGRAPSHGAVLLCRLQHLSPIKLKVLAAPYISCTIYWIFACCHLFHEPRKVKPPFIKNYYSTLRQNNGARFNMRTREVSAVTGNRRSSGAAARAVQHVCLCTHTDRTAVSFECSERKKSQFKAITVVITLGMHVRYFLYSCNVWAAVAKSMPPPPPVHIAHDGTPCTVHRSWTGFRKCRL